MKEISNQCNFSNEDRSNITQLKKVTQKIEKYRRMFLYRVTYKQKNSISHQEHLKYWEL